MNPFILALNHGSHLGTKETEGDVSVAWRCPKCEQVRLFILVTTEGNFTVLGVPVGSPATVLDLRCVVCGYEFAVPKSEQELLIQVRDLTAALRAGAILAEVYVEKLRAIPARFMQNMIALTAEWSCSKCGERNPVTFDSCWNCRSKVLG